MKYLFYFLLSLLVITTACNDSVIVGSDLLSNEAVDVEYNETIPLTAKTVFDDSTLMFRKLESNNFAGQTFLFGEVDDSSFGKTVTTTYFSPTTGNGWPGFRESTIDSVVMTLALDTFGIYGDPTAVHDISLSLLTERMDLNDREEFYSNQSLEAEATPIFTTSTRINYTDSLTINEYFRDSIISVEPQLRFKLDKQLFEDIDNAIDSVDFDSLLDMLPGFELKSTTTASSMASINLSYSATTTNPSNIIVYYNQGDTLQVLYRIPLGQYRHSFVEKDYTGSAILSDQSADNPDCLYLESQGGANIVVDVAAISEVDDQILNYATMEVTVKAFDEDLDPAIVGIGAWYEDEDGELVRADRTDQLALLEESFPDGEQTWTYTLDLTSYLSSLRDGLITNSELTLIALSKSQQANRAIINSPTHPDKPLKLNLVLTKP